MSQARALVDGMEQERMLATVTLVLNSVHDIKNKIALIKGLSQLGAEEVKGEGSCRLGKYYQEISKHADSLEQMIRGYLNICKEEVFLEEESINDTIEAALQEIRPLCRLSRVSLQFSKDRERCLKMNRELLVKAVLNLLLNAIQAMPQGGKLEVSLKDDLIIIKDNGQGIPPTMQRDLFKPFQTTKQNGSGLGLYMVYYVITVLHAGQIWYESNMNKGTTFYIKIG